MQTVIVNRNRAGQHGLEQGDQSRLQFLEQGNELARGGTGLVMIEQGVIRGMGVAQIGCLFLFQCEDGGEVGEESLEVVLGARLYPYLLSQGTFAAEPDDKIGREFLGPAVIPPDLPKQRLGRFIPGICRACLEVAGLEIQPLAQQPFDIGGHQAIVRQSLQGGDVIGPSRAASGWHVGFHIPG